MGTQGTPGATGEVREDFLGMVTPNGIPTHMHNSRDSTRRLSRAMPSGCTSLPESPAARCSVCRTKRIFRHASSSSGAASDPPRLLQGPAFLGRLSQKTNSKLFCQSKLRVKPPSPGCHNPPRATVAHASPLSQSTLAGYLLLSPLLKRKRPFPGGKLEAFRNPPTTAHCAQQDSPNQGSGVVVGGTPCGTTGI